MNVLASGSGVAALNREHERRGSALWSTLYLFINIQLTVNTKYGHTTDGREIPAVCNLV